MNNSIQAGGNELVFVDYSELLDKILQVLRQQQLFRVSDDRHRLLIDINTVASQVANLQLSNPLGASANSAKAATINFSPGFKENFKNQIQAIADCLHQQLESTILKQPSTTVKEFVENLVTDLQTFKGSTPSLNFTYPFTPYQGLQKQRLTFPDKGAKSKEILKFHKLTITVQKTRDFNEQLRDGLENYIKVQFKSTSEEDREELGYILEELHKEKENRELDFYRLRRIVDKETLGKLKKQAQINYLEYLYENIHTDASTTNAQAAMYLQDTIRRLRLIEEYINDVNKADGDYQVNYAGISLNYRDIFSRGEAFDMLPIIPKIEGYLGETKDEERGEIQFIFGLKLKFDGKVQAYGGKTVSEYYLNLLNPDTEEHQVLADPLKKETFARKVLKIAFLYYFLFALNPNSSELAYNPIPNFEQKVIPILKSDDDAAKQQLFRDIIKYFNKLDVLSKIKQLKKLLINVIKSKRTFPHREYPQHITIKKSILEQEINNIFNQNTFFKPVLRGNPKEILKYIAIGEANATTNSLCSLPAKITISDIHYVSCDERQSLNMEYDIANIRALPVLFLPWENKKCQDVYSKTFQERKLVLFPYRLEETKLEAQQAFIYLFTFSLLAYISIKVLLQEQKRLFLPILRLHLHNKEDDAPIEKFIVSLSGVLSHLFNEEHRSNAQGIDIRDLQTKGKFKVPNVLSSLYSVLPKKFTFSNPSDYPKIVDKLAIVVVSSRESDRRWGGTQKLSNLMGEILGLRCLDGAVRVQLLKTFSDNYENQQMFRYPTVVIDEVAKLYKMGFRHFLYIAKAPYSSTLHMTQTEDDDGLFFLSREVIKAFKEQHDDIKIYPMFFDKYYAVKIEDKIGVPSLYIQDTAELTNLVDDPSQKSVVFFNLFNGITVGKQEERHYNGVISYATLLKIYEGILDDEDIYKGLIFKGEQKNDILQYLTLFHFSRYEQHKQINLKLDPYENLIGDRSVGALSLFNHMRGKGEFNSLAFLTEVKKILNVNHR
ncbi:hypothetical protein [Iningainema tapete]|uniref:Uncharacterized protein n=1 Tax=Iningainema tapete BLCC-T55 TaxID=2748662 RepID=A0A8J6XH28_9CYAN|nr:hypothetical protein [Iningainema tapete BLCC-T55]